MHSSQPQVATAAWSRQALSNGSLGRAVSNTRLLVYTALLVALGGLVVGATLWAFVVRPLLWPFVNAVRHTPVLSRSGYLGVKVQVKPDHLLLSFSNEDYASEFALANLGAWAIS